jgi:alpha-tubulin suppressor-like RCC1 family protein
MTQLIDPELPPDQARGAYFHNLMNGQSVNWFSADASPRELINYVLALLDVKFDTLKYNEFGTAITDELLMTAGMSERGSVFSVWGYGDPGAAILNGAIKIELDRMTDELSRGEYTGEGPLGTTVTTIVHGEVAGHPLFSDPEVFDFINDAELISVWDAVFLNEGAKDNDAQPVAANQRSSDALPVEHMDPETRLSAVATGSRHSLLLDDVGQVWACGYNYHGQLGAGSDDAQFTPVRVVGLPAIRAIQAGGHYSLALGTEGSLWAWGDNEDGQLGLGDTTQRDIPVQQSNPGAFVAVSAIWRHTLALDADGTVWGWGFNQDGQLGQGFETLPEPFRIAGLPTATAVSAGGHHSLALDADGQVWAWGRNGDGQLGNGGKSFSKPSTVEGLPPISKIYAASWHSLALDSDGQVWVWGWNEHGQLATGDHEDKNLPVLVPGLPKIVSIVGGENHSLALDADGQLWGWGDNSKGQLALGDVSSQLTPALLPRPTNVVRAAGGPTHTIALDDSARAWGWGNNDMAQFGTGDRLREEREPVRAGVAG